MSGTLSRVARGTFALILFGAVANVAIAKAQTQVQSGDGSGPPAISTACGAGTLEKCNDDPIVVCDWDIGLMFNPILHQYQFGLKKTNCKVVGTRPVYKDRIGTCDTFGGGSRGAGDIRGSGEEEEPFDFGTC